MFADSPESAQKAATEGKGDGALEPANLSLLAGTSAQGEARDDHDVVEPDQRHDQRHVP